MGSKAGYCARCGKKIVGTPHKINDAFYCGDCYQNEMQSLAALESEKKALYDYIKELFGKTSCPEPITNAVERSLSSGKKIAGIRFTIYYYYQILANVAENINEVPWIIRDYYDEARDYAMRMRQLGESNRKVKIEKVPSQIKIRQPSRRHRLRRKITTED